MGPGVDPVVRGTPVSTEGTLSVPGRASSRSGSGLQVRDTTGLLDGSEGDGVPGVQGHSDDSEFVWADGSKHLQRRAQDGGEEGPDLT